MNLAAKIENSQMLYQNTRNEISDPMDTIRCKSNNSSDHERGTIFDLLVNNPALGSRKTNSSQALDAEESRRRHEKFKEHLINATKPHKPFDALHNSISEPNSNADEISKDDGEKSRLSADQEKHPNSTNNGPDSSVAASVQAALNALQAGQLSLNQVTKFGNFLPSLVSIIYNSV